MLLKAYIPSYVVNLTLAVLLTSYMLYGFVSMPPDLDQNDVMFWVYAKGKVTNGLSSIGGYLGLGHQASLYRKLKSNLFDPIGTNRSEHVGINVTDDVFDGVNVRVYEPRNKVRNGPAVIFFHGGLWISGNVDNHDHITSRMAKVLGVVVVSVEYRLAPEHQYPEPLDDCFTATKFLITHSKQYSVDASSIALFGIDSGANLAAAVVLRLRDSAEDLPAPSLQVLVNPLLQAMDFKTPSYYQNQYDAAFPKSLVINSWLWYGLGRDAHRKYSSEFSGNYHTSNAAKQSKLGSFVSHSLIHRKHLHQSYMPNRVDFGDDGTWQDIKDVISDPYFAPLMAENLRGLPKSYIVASQYDVVRDDALMYAKRLEKAGNSVTLVHVEKAIHNLILMTNEVTLGSNIQKDVEHFLLNNL